MIDAYLRSQSELDDHAIHLLFSANRWELAYVLSSLSLLAFLGSTVIDCLPLTNKRTSICAHLAAGMTVIADRYAFSGIAFSARKGLSYEWCRAPDVGLPAPDLTVFLDVEPEVARARGGYGEERYEQEGIQRGVRAMFERIGEEMNRDGQGKWVVIDASKEKDWVARDIWHVVESLAEGVDAPTAKLWQTRLST